MQCKGHSTWAIHWILEHWPSIWQSQEIHNSSHQPTDHQVKELKMNRPCMKIVTCKYSAPTIYSSSLQHIPLWNTHQCNIWAGELRIHTISFSTKGLPNLSFMDHRCPCFIRRFGQTMEDVYTTEGEITSTTKFSTADTTSSKLPILSITGRIGKHGQHLYIIQTTYTHSDTTTEDRTFFQWHITFRQMHQEKPLTPLRGHSQVTHLDSYNERCKRY